MLQILQERDINIFKTKYFLGSELNDEFVNKLINKNSK